MTFSIVARDPATGDLGVAVASKFLAVGSVVPWARAGVGAIATQAYANVRFGPDGLDLLADGLDAGTVLGRLIAADDAAGQRQAGIVDATGGTATHTGEACLPWAGGRTGDGVAAQGNILAGPEVVDAMLRVHAAEGGAFPDQLLAALAAGDAAGGDRRGRQSAALLVVRLGGGYAGGNDRWLDLRVDDHPDPIAELVRLRAIGRLLNERPEPGDLVPVDDALAAELQRHLAALGWSPDADDAFATRMRAEMGGVPRVAAGRTATRSATWTDGWDAAFLGWMGVANLEERSAEAGWIDPVVLAELRAAAGAER
jgi:uncharacterized Ntn-hydrolase superfamily protein